MSVEIYATLGEPHEVAATLSDLRYLVFQGMKGDTGDSAYEEAVALGFVGTEAEWIASLKGEKGDKGDTGDTGATGQKGDKGDTGSKGDKGDKGDPGEDGTDGNDGVSPTVTVANIAGGHRVTITDAEHPQGQSFAVMNGSGISEDVKVALLDCFEHVAWIDADGQDYYDALYAALYPPKTLVSISAAFNQGTAVIYDTDDLDTLKQYLTVTATYDDTSTGVVTTYTLSGTLTEGTSTITVLYNGKTATFSVAVSTLNITDVLTLDGINNTRNGHDSTSTTWFDLSENHYDFAKASDASALVWASDHASIDATDRRVQNSSITFANLTKMTFEAVVKVTGNGSYSYNDNYYGSIFDNCGWDETNALRFATRNNNLVTAKLGNTTVLNSEIGANTIAYIAIVVANGTATAYVNGEVVKTTAITFPPSAYRTANAGGFKATTNNFFPNADVYRIGISSAALSASQIASRYSYFRDRFSF